MKPCGRLYEPSGPDGVVGRVSADAGEHAFKAFRAASVFEYVYHKEVLDRYGGGDYVQVGACYLECGK